MEIGSDEEEEAPKLIKKEVKAQKGKNKRVAEDSDEEPANLDDIMAKSLKPAEPITNGEPKLSKKQLKKLKNNAGKAVEAAVEAPEVRKEEKKNGKKEEPASKDADSSKTDKKVQFAKNLEQGPAVAMKDKKADGKADAKAGAKADVKSETKKEGEKPKATLGPKTVQGVKIDDKKLGQGPASKKGNKVGMRYIGKLEDGKVFDGMWNPRRIPPSQLPCQAPFHTYAPAHISSSQQKRQTLPVQARQRRGHQRLGHRRRRHVRRRRAKNHRPCALGLWQQIAPWNPTKFDAHL